MRIGRSRCLAACAVGVAGLLAGLATPVSAQAPAGGTEQAAKTKTFVTVILRNGRTVEGELLEETTTSLRMMVKIGNFSPTETTYSKADILSIERKTMEDAGAPAPAPAATPAPGAVKAADPVRPVRGATDARKVYLMELKGVFGEDITQTPIRQAIKDAKKFQPDFLVVSIENDWSELGGLVELPDDTYAAEELFRAEDIAPIFSQEVPHEWGEGTPPKLIFWVKQAMGGSALLAMASPTIYFTSEARLGGIGNLSVMLGQQGSERVREKLYSAYMAHVEGWAVSGGYDYRLVRALARIEYVLSYRMEGGEPVFLEREPQSPDEFLLTDDGLKSPDTILQRARGEGDDVLTLNATLAQKLRFSKGTADTMDELLFQLGIGRNHEIVPGNAKRIMEGWLAQVTQAKRDLRDLRDRFAGVQVQGTYDERKRARGQQMSLLKQMKDIMKRYGESITGEFYQRYGIPDEATIDILLEQIRLEQLADRK